MYYKISTSSTCEYKTILCKILNIKEGYLKQQVKPYSFNCLTTLGCCIAIIKLKTSGMHNIYRFLGFPEVILKVRLFGKICLGGVSYWKSTILVICVLKVLNWPYNFLFDVHTLNNLFVPEIKDQIVLVLINNWRYYSKKERALTKKCLHYPTSNCILPKETRGSFNFRADYWK